MSILKHLTSYEFLAEAPEIPVELKKLFAPGVSQNFSAQALKKLWGGKRLSWNGDKFFGDGELGPAYEKAEKAAVDFMNDGYTADVNMDMDVLDGEEDDTHDFRFDVEFNHADHQECYLGYDPKSDKLYIGFDVHTSDETFNSDFDAAFSDAHDGTEHDMDDEDHQRVYNKLWQEYNSSGYGFWGAIFEISHDTEAYTADEAFPAAPRGFYKGLYKEFKKHHPNVIDLRLD